MELKKLISRKIDRKLGFTNGWRVTDEKYKRLCDEVAEDIYNTINKKITFAVSEDSVQ